MRALERRFDLCVTLERRPEVLLELGIASQQAATARHGRECPAAVRVQVHRLEVGHDFLGHSVIALARECLGELLRPRRDRRLAQALLRGKAPGRLEPRDRLAVPAQADLE